MALLGCGFILGITIVRPTQDNTILIGSVLTAMAPTTVALLALLKSHESLKKSEETHLAVNSRLDQFIAAQAAIAHALGVKVERERAAAAAAAAAAAIERPTA